MWWCFGLGFNHENKGEKENTKEQRKKRKDGETKRDKEVRTEVV